LGVAFLAMFNVKAKPSQTQSKYLRTAICGAGARIEEEKEEDEEEEANRAENKGYQG
jgi:hypothetical protein